MVDPISAMSGDRALAVLQNSPGAVLCMDKAGRVIFANQVAIRLIGPGEPLLGRLIQDFIPDWTALLSGPCPPLNTKTAWAPRHGHKFPVELSVTDLTEGGVGFFAAYLRDTSDRSVGDELLQSTRNEAAEALEEAKMAERRMRAIIEMLPQAVCVFDAQDRYVLWNQKYAETYPEIAHLLAPRVPFRDILEASLASTRIRERVVDSEAWLEQRLAKHALPASQEEQELSDGRWLRHDDRRLADGGAIGMRIDITDLKHREASFRLLFQNNPVPMVISDPDSLRVIDVNEAATKLYGFRRQEFLSMTAPELHSDDQAEEARRTLASVVDAYDGRKVWRQRTASGDEIHVLMFVRALLYEKRRGFLTAVADVSDRVRAEARISHMAHHDPLTGLANRLHFHAALEQAIKMQQGAWSLAVLYVDLDGFKPVNDAMGHRSGDSLLRIVAARLRAAVRSNDLIARLGGDEFAILQSQTEDLSATVAKRVIETLRQPFEIDDRKVTIGASVGIAVLPSGAAIVSPDLLIAAADAALYEAKRAGKNTWRRSGTWRQECA